MTPVAHLSAASASSPQALAARATQVLSFLEDASKPGAQPLPFVTEMHSRRPYRTWTREVSNVTKEVFWIFLHHANVIALPNTSSTTSASDPSRPTPFPEGPASPSAVIPQQAQSYTRRHFPGTRPPVPAAPYIGGVEWDATTYLTAHLDLLNGLLASLPTKQARNALRGDLASSGFEKVMGGTLRTCKEKFYAGVHDALRTWVGAAIEDGWSGVESVRTGVSGSRGGRADGEDVLASPGKKRVLSREEKETVALPALELGSGLGKGGDDLDGWLA